VSSARAVVAEPDLEFGKVIAAALELAGFAPSRCVNSVQFRIELHSLLLPGVESVLLVVAEPILRADRTAIAAAAKTWRRLRTTPILGIWTTESADRDTPEQVEDVELLAVLEKPFELRELTRIAQMGLIRVRSATASYQR
jgi:hypothetical protein